jgi:hypothetical protein
MFKRLLILCALAALLPLNAYASTATFSSWGPRVGFSSNPDQIVFGGQMEIADVAPNLTFNPDLELGFGDHATVIAFNLDMHYNFEVSGANWRPYAGAGLGINFIQVDTGPFGQDASDTTVGGNLIVGASVPTKTGSQFFGELKLGLGDVPDLKLMVGWNFKR